MLINYKIVFNLLLFIYCYGDIYKGRLLENYMTTPRICSLNGQLGKCQFLWDCFKTNGINLGLCRLDTNIYGSCCGNLTKSLTTMKTTTETTTIKINKFELYEFIVIDGEKLKNVLELNISTIQPSIDKNYKCGLVKKKFEKKSTRIIGGKDANFAEYPWIASIRRSSLFGYSSTHSCGGVLLNENWIVTAAHCVATISKSLIRIRLGEFNFKTENHIYPYIEKKIEKKIIHPNYNFSSYESDLALLKLQTSINYNIHISPLCLPNNNNSLINKMGNIIGWGRLSEGGKYSQLLQSVNVPIISNEECIKMFKQTGRIESIPEHFICAGYKNGGKDGCQGDSGGPLQIKTENNNWFLAGIMSWGIGCGEPNSPGVYTRISLFTDWIQQNII